MKITAIECVLFEPTWDDPLAPKRGPLAALKIRTDDGLVGISRTGGAQVPYIQNYLQPVLLGEDPRNVERLWAKMYDVMIPMLGHEKAIVAAIGAVDVGLWDLRGKSASLPCWQLLGGYRDWIPAYADVPTRSQTPQELGKQLRACVDLGYDAVKFHILRRDPGDIVAETRAAREAIGPNVKLMVDIFRALEPRDAIDVARRIEEFDIFWIEEPVRWHDQPLGLSLVAHGTRIPIAGGEGESSIYGCRQILERGGVTYLQANILGIGGYTNWLKIAGLTQAFHVKVAPHGATLPEINAHLVAAIPNGVIVPATTLNQPPEIWGHLYQEFKIDRGKIQLTNRPGLGLEFDEAFLARYQIATVS